MCFFIYFVVGLTNVDLCDLKTQRGTNGRLSLKKISKFVIWKKNLKSYFFKNSTLLHISHNHIFNCFCLFNKIKLYFLNYFEFTNFTDQQRKSQALNKGFY